MQRLTQQGISTLPANQDLLERLKFTPEQGRISLGEQRMMLLHTAALSALRAELIDTLGMERARGLLTRMGYVSGAGDAALARTVRANASALDAFSVGPQLHSVEGVVRVELVRLEIDLERGHHYHEALWHDSTEDEDYIARYGLSNEPACWMQIGYACGYASAFMGRPILYREVECRSTGYALCRLIGKPVDEWDDPELDLYYLGFEHHTFAPHAPKRTGASRRSRDPGPPATGAAKGWAGEPLIGAAPSFQQALQVLQQVAPTDSPVLLVGETGVGKECFARRVHQLSPRAHGPFVAVNCAALPDSLIEAELFGVEKGAYTGANASRPGRFERADGGSLFLDEVSSLGLAAQGKLLRAIQEQEVERVGGCAIRRVDVRIIAASNVDLAGLVRNGHFRSDLFYRLNVFPLRLPALRERRADIPLLVEHFRLQACARHRKPAAGLTPQAEAELLDYPWPGNVRELQNIVERGVVLAPAGAAIDVCHLFIAGEESPAGTWTMTGAGADPAQDVPQDATGDMLGWLNRRGLSLPELEAELLEAAVSRGGGNLSQAARTLGISRAQLAYRLDKHRSGGA